jgi:hypothetical protein
VVISAVLLPSVFYSPAVAKSVYYVAAIWLVLLIVQNPPKHSRLWIFVGMVVTVQTVFAVWTYIDGAPRQEATQLISRNASAFGISGLAIPHMIWTVPLIGLSLSRSALAGYLLFAVLRNSRRIWLLTASIIAVFIVISFVTNQESRIGLSSSADTPVNFNPTNQKIVSSVELRYSAVTGNTPEKPRECGELQPRKLRLFGYGYGGYCLSTGLIQPHTPYVSTIWELGILAIPFWIAVMWLWWQSRNMYLLVIAGVALFADEFYSSIEGVFIIAGFHLATRTLPSPLDNWSTVAKMTVRLFSLSRFRGSEHTAAPIHVSASAEGIDDG